MISIGYGEGASEEIERRVRLRMARTELLRQPDAPRMWVVLDEAELRRSIGGPPSGCGRADHGRSTPFRNLYRR